SAPRCSASSSSMRSTVNSSPLGCRTRTKHDKSHLLTRRCRSISPQPQKDLHLMWHSRQSQNARTSPQFWLSMTVHSDRLLRSFDESFVDQITGTTELAKKSHCAG